MIKAGIVGVSGYSGFEALKILLNHPQARVTYTSAINTTGKIADIWPELKGKTNLICEKFDAKVAAEQCDVIFLAVPHTESMHITPKLLKLKKIVIDLSGDYRLNSKSVYKKWYGHEHTDISNLRKAVYGLPELYREEIKHAKLIANPGCYPTATLLGLLPIASSEGKNIQSIIVDAKSGVSGAGKKASLALNYCEVNENFKAYKVLNHQHAPEIDLYLKNIGTDIPAQFVPHLLPVNRGILATIYIHLKRKVSLGKLQTVYKRFYKTEPFVRICGSNEQPELKHVTFTNYCNIGLTLSADKKLVVVTSVIDNLIKGAAGQAVQNMNIICGFKETDGLL